jgi:hypothetical protein
MLNVVRYVGLGKVIIFCSLKNLYAAGNVYEKVQENSKKSGEYRCFLDLD